MANLSTGNDTKTVLESQQREHEGLTTEEIKKKIKRSGLGCGTVDTHFDEDPFGYNNQ